MSPQWPEILCIMMQCWNEIDDVMEDIIGEDFNYCNTTKRLLTHRKLLRQKCAENSVQCIKIITMLRSVFLESETLLRTSLSDGCVSFSIGELQEEKIDDQDMIIKLQKNSFKRLMEISSQ